MKRKRWTILVVSHDTNAPRSFDVSARTIRVAASVASLIVLVALIGVGTLVAQLGKLPVRSVARLVREPSMLMATKQSSAEVVGLRNQVNALRGALDTIYLDEARLRAAAGLATTDSTTLLRRFLSHLPVFLRPRSRAAGTDEGDVRRDAVVPADSVMLRRFAARANASADSLTEFAGDVAKGLRTLATQVDRTRSNGPANSMSLERTAWETIPVDGRTARGIEWRAPRETRLLASHNGQVRSVSETEDDSWEIELVNAVGDVVRIRSRGRALVDAGERIVRAQPVFIVDSLGVTERLRIDWIPAPTTTP